MSEDPELSEMEEYEAELAAAYYNIEKLEAKIKAIKTHWFDKVPPFTMPFLDCPNEAVQKYIQDMTNWGRDFVNILEDRESEVKANE